MRQAAAQQRGEDDAVETVDLGDKKRESGTASGEREGVADAPEMPKETEKEQNGLDSLSLDSLPQGGKDGCGAGSAHQHAAFRQNHGPADSGLRAAPFWTATESLWP